MRSNRIGDYRFGFASEKETVRPYFVRTVTYGVSDKPLQTSKIDFGFSRFSAACFSLADLIQPSENELNRSRIFRVKSSCRDERYDWKGRLLFLGVVD